MNQHSPAIDGALRVTKEYFMDLANALELAEAAKHQVVKVVDEQGQVIAHFERPGLEDESSEEKK